MNLNEAIKAVAPHTSKDKLVPVLTGVQIQNGRAMATDRYTLAIVEVEGLEQGVTAWLSPDDIKAGVKAIANGMLTLANGATKPVTETPGDFPAIERLIDNFTPNTGAPEHIQAISFDVVHLSKFARKFLPKTIAKTAAPRFEFGINNTAAARVTFTEWPEYTALIVPVKITENKS